MKLSNYSFIFVLVFYLVMLSYAQPPEKEIDVAQVRKAIEEANLKFCEGIRQGDGAALAACYTEDATILPPDSDMIQGKKGIKTFWSGAIQMGVKDAVLTIVDVFGSGNLAYEIGKFTLTFQPEGQEPFEQKGKYLVVWKQTADGSWKLHVDIWNSGKPAQQ